jgi:hypothetical protein
MKHSRILEHHLATPLATEIERLSDAGKIQQGLVSEWIRDSKCKTFGELIAHDFPSHRMLQLVKDFGKAAMSDPDGLPREVARVIYLSAILRGRVTGQHVSTLDKASIEREARRCLAWGWLPESTRALFRKGLSSC